MHQDESYHPVYLRGSHRPQRLKYSKCLCNGNNKHIRAEKAVADINMHGNNQAKLITQKAKYIRTYYKSRAHKDEINKLSNNKTTSYKASNFSSHPKGAAHGTKYLKKQEDQHH